MTLKTTVFNEVLNVLTGVKLCPAAIENER